MVFFNDCIMLVYDAFELGGSEDIRLPSFPIPANVEAAVELFEEIILDIC